MKDRISGKYIWIAAVAIAAIPVLFWLFMEPVAGRFGSAFYALSSLGQITGLVGMAGFSLSLILSARLKFFDRIFSGLNKVYVSHHWIGGVSFILLLFHPLFLGARLALNSLRSAALFFIPGSDFPVDLGIYSLLVMMFLLIITFFAAWRYHNWKLSHKFLGLAFFLGGMHSFFISSDISRNSGLRIYMLSLAALGLVAFVYRTLAGGRLAKKYFYKISKINRPHSLVLNIRLSAEGEEMPYEAGQFVFVSFADNDGWAEEHPFSLLSCPSDEYLSLGIKTNGDYVKNLASLTVGTRVRLEGPYGKFSYKETEGKKQIWIAGGIGITPFISMARDLGRQPDFGGFNVDLYYCVKTEDEFLALDELKNLSEKFSGNFRLLLHCSTVRGYINGDYILNESRGLAGKQIFLCGPVPMMRGLKKHLIEKGVKKNNLHSEEFSF